MVRYRLRLLGGFHLSRSDQAVDLTSNKQRLLLAIVALSHPEPVPRQRLVDLLWGSRFEDQARQSLRQALTRLRAIFGAEFLVTGGETVGLRPDAIECDVHEFRRLAAEGTRDSLKAAAALYQGEFLSGISAQEEGVERWRAAAGEELRELALDALIALAGAELDVGATHDAVAVAQRAVALDEFREDAHRQLIIALAASGRRPDAIRHGTRLRDMLRRELGTGIDEQTSALLAQLHSRAASADAPAPPAGEGTRQAPPFPPEPIPGKAASRPEGGTVDAGPKQDEPRAAPLHTAARQVGAERREITALSFEFEGIDVASHGLDEAWEEVRHLHEEVSGIIEGLGGVVRQLPGASGIAFFGFPEADEDAAISAVNAGLTILRRWDELAESKAVASGAVSVGIATSLAVVDPGASAEQMSVLGAAPNLATELRERAEAKNSVLVCETTSKRTRQTFRYRPAGDVAMPGGAAAVKVWRAVSFRRSRDRFSAHRNRKAPIVGRSAELALLLDRWKKAASGRGQIVLLQGEAGIGKSRLVRELSRAAGLRRGQFQLFQCAPQAMNVMLHPILDRIAGATGGTRSKERALAFPAVKRLLLRNGLKDIEAIEVLSFLVGAGGPAAERLRGESSQRIREQANHALRRSIEDLTAEGPVLIALEDAHWADPTSLQFVEELVEWVHDRPVLIVLTSRIAKFEQWLGESNFTQLMLNRLDLSDAAELVRAGWDEARLGPLPPKAIDMIYRTTDGIPLFVEELTQWLLDHAHGDAPAWESLLAEASVDSLGGLLAARLDSLGDAKRVAQAAAVVGRRFNIALLGRVLAPERSLEEIGGGLEVLSRAGLARPTRMAGGGYIFRHALIQKAAYESLLRKERQALHRKIYDAVSSDREQRSWMGEATLALHAELANLIEQAVRLYLEAGRESSARSAVTEARQLLDHALSLCERIAEPELRESLELSAMAALGPVLVNTEGSLPRARQLYEHAVEIAKRRPQSELAELFPVYWGWWITGGSFGVQRQRAAEVLDRFRDVPDPEIRLQAWHCVWAIDFNIGRHRSCLDAIEQGLRLYQPGRGDETRILYGGHDPKVCGLGQRAQSLWLTGAGISATQAIGRARQWADEIRHLGSIAHVLDMQALFHKYRRDYAELTKIAQEMNEFAAVHDLRSLQAKGLMFSGWAIGKTAEPRRGRDMMQNGLDLQREIGTREDFPVYSEMLAELAGLCGEPCAGLQLIAEALDEAERTDHRFWLPELYRRRARLLRQEGDDGEAAAASVTAALEIAAQQGANMLLLRAWHSGIELGVADLLDSRLRSNVHAAVEAIEPDEEASAALSEIAASLA